MNNVGKFWTDKILPHVPGIIQRNFWRLLFSFLFAFLLFNLVHKNIKEETEYHKITLNGLEISIVPEAEDGDPYPFELVQQKIKSPVSVSLSIPEYEKDVKSEDFYLECSVTKRQIDQNAPISFSAENLKLKRGVSFRDPKIDPPILSLTLDYYVEKNVAVNPTFEPKEIVDGYQLESKPTCDALVKIRGPKKVLAGITQLNTEKIPLSNKTQNFTCSLNPVLPFEARNNGVEILSDAVQVNVKFKQNDSEVFDGIPLRILTGKGVAGNLGIDEIRPETVKVTVQKTSGNDPFPDKEIIMGMIHAVVDLSDVTKAEQYTKTIKYWSDDPQFKVVELEPKEASVTLVPSAPQQ